MTVTATDRSARYDASAATSHAEWMARLEEITEEEGYFEPLGTRHFAFFADEGPTLLVTFETLESIRARPEQMPEGCQAVARNGWSHLCVIADGDTWYRDPAVWRYFDRLVDDAFFEDFDRVVFYGAGMGGYAACAFSVCAPGATVLTINPRATLDPSIAPWDRRDLAKRRLDFTSRYGYAPDMIEGTGEVFVIHDPHSLEDSMHAALFTKPFVQKLRTPWLGDRVQDSLITTGILPGLIDAAGEGRLTPALFAREWRKRREHGPYLKALLHQTETRGQTRRSLAICRSVAERMNAPRFRRHVATLEARLADGAD
ncbi:hypothetical protein IQ03_03768 [Gemmobacter caeni]|uniref:Phosphoadenosine phosphosulfate reductase n=2 Tax=Gemmobacter caeni TaxID=589035 RepID=A0A2T6ARB7_9RHOB|nr:hypothetical protein C8N34_11725 [Gemmobacter caeni]TWI95169.1 hypothetical protein IQ03_03768 [Gemmobacter caeni]